MKLIVKPIPQVWKPKIRLKLFFSKDTTIQPQLGEFRIGVETFRNKGVITFSCGILEEPARSTGQEWRKTEASSVSWQSIQNDIGFRRSMLHNLHIISPHCPLTSYNSQNHNILFWRMFVAFNFVFWPNLFFPAISFILIQDNGPCTRHVWKKKK